MTFDECRRQIEAAANQVTAEELPGDVGAGPEAWKVVKRVRRNGIPFNDAIWGTALSTKPPRTTAWARRQVERLNTATGLICRLLEQAERDRDLAPGDPERLEELVHDSLVSPGPE